MTGIAGNCMNKSVSCAGTLYFSNEGSPLCFDGV